MKPVIQQLLNEVETGQPGNKLGCLIGIGDYIEHPYPHEDGYVEVVQQLIALLSKEKEHEARKLLVRNIERAYMSTISLEEISFEPLIEVLESNDPYFIRCVLYLLSMTYNSKYIPVIEKHLDHHDKTVSDEAQQILDTW
jgi:hypothetical protein